MSNDNKDVIKNKELETGDRYCLLYVNGLLFKDSNQGIFKCMIDISEDGKAYKLTNLRSLDSRLK